MNKKQYFKPEILVVKLSNKISIMAGSPGPLGIKREEEEVDAGDAS